MISRHIDIVAVGVLLLAILIFSEARKSIWVQVIKDPARLGATQHMHVRVPEPPLPPVVFN
jgi:hypothetical protein